MRCRPRRQCSLRRIQHRLILTEGEHRVIALVLGLVPAYKRHMTFRAAASPLICAITAVLLTLTLSAPASALSVVPRSFDELVNLADLVIVGTVSARGGAGGGPGRRRGGAAGRAGGEGE